MALSVAFFVVAAIAAASASKHVRVVHEVYSSHTVGFTGEWGNKDVCPHGQYVVGFSLKSEKDKGTFGDDTALNGIRLTCSGGSTVSSTVHKWGDWSPEQTCNGAINGFQVQIDPKRGGFLRIPDNTAANNVNFFCENGDRLEGQTQTHWGKWSSKLSCGNGQVAIGLQTRVQNAKGILKDDTALNGMKLLCALKSAAVVTKPVVKPIVTKPVVKPIVTKPVVKPVVIKPVVKTEKPVLTVTELYGPQTVGFTGDWGNKDVCPDGQYVVGFSLKSEKDKGVLGDDTALNGVRLICNGGSTVTSTVHKWGDWTASQRCNGAVKGFQIQIEPKGLLRDNSAANNVNFQCKEAGGYRQLQGKSLTHWGKWSNWLTCPAGKVVIGLQTRVQNAKGVLKDDTALNGMKLLCAERVIFSPTATSTWILTFNHVKYTLVIHHGVVKFNGALVVMYNGHSARFNIKHGWVFFVVHNAAYYFKMSVNGIHEVVRVEGEDTIIKGTVERKISTSFMLADKGYCTTVTREHCQAIAKVNGIEFLEIANPYRFAFPPGCYYKKRTNKMYFNVQHQKAKCNYARVCICASGPSRYLKAPTDMKSVAV